GTGVPYAQYDVIVYFFGYTDPLAQGKVSITMTTGPVEDPRRTGVVLPEFNGSYLESTGTDLQTANPGNYVQFRGLTATTFSLFMAGGNNTPFVPVNGLQIIPVPEPSTWSLLI